MCNHGNTQEGIFQHKIRQTIHYMPQVNITQVNITHVYLRSSNNSAKQICPRCYSLAKYPYSIFPRSTLSWKYTRKFGATYRRQTYHLDYSLLQLASIKCKMNL